MSKDKSEADFPQSKELKLKAFSPVLKKELPGEFKAVEISTMNEIAENAHQAFHSYSKKTAAEKAAFLEAIGEAIMELGDDLIQRAMLETGLPESRLVAERGRTVTQLKMFADILLEGSWIEAVIDTALPHRKPLPRPDLRKMLMPVGPVLVFGAGNFPFAFSTAGGDTASALAAGNPVIVKAHEGHLGTNELVASAIRKAGRRTDMPEAVFSVVVSKDVNTIHTLVKNEAIKAIGFTGSYHAGASIFKTATTTRKTPIPVFAEMSSVNPVLVLPNKIEQEGEMVAIQLAGSITLGVGQFCTNPGLIFLIDTPAAQKFVATLGELVLRAAPATMLNKAVCQHYYSARILLQQQPGVSVLAAVSNADNIFEGAAVLLQTTATYFVSNEHLQAEVFGPSSMIVMCRDESALLEAIQALRGQLTGTVIGLSPELGLFSETINALTSKVGRLIFNGVPTGVEVCHAMVHGGPYPATTNAASTSVGADAIKRFVRPVCFQDCPPELLPDPLQDKNTFNIMRKINGHYTRDNVTTGFGNG